MTRLVFSLFTLTVIILCSAEIFGGDVADYRKRIESARAGVESLLSNVAAEEVGEVPKEPSDEIFKAVKELIPASERIEGESGTVETSNQWFTERLAAAESEKDLAKRAVILNELNERLAAVTVKLDELQNAAARDRSKDEEKRKLSEILNREEYQKPVQKEQSQFPEWLRKLIEWIESLLPKFGPPTGSLSGFGTIVSVLQYVLIGLIILLLAFIIYKLIPLFAPRFRRKEKEELPERVILGERIDEDMSAADLFGDAERLARSGDIRGAIRKGYIALLCELSDRKLIGLARHKTNRDYLRDVRSRREIYGTMNGLTADFERVWYGSQETAADDWEDFRRRCGETVKAI